MVQLDFKLYSAVRIGFWVVGFRCRFVLALNLFVRLDGPAGAESDFETMGVKREWGVKYIKNFYYKWGFNFTLSKIIKLY